MAEHRVERRLAAIFAADVAGYSRLMGLDEEGTLAQLKAHRRALIDPKIAEHRGRIVKTTGDGMLVEFVSVVDAVRCALDVQNGMIPRNTGIAQAERIEFRIGINVGDIIAEDQDIFGDGVNIAARLEGFADPGGICVSARVKDDVDGRLDTVFEDIGEQRLKNIAKPVRVYRLRPGRTEVASDKPMPPLPDKPSIAVLPFQNMSGDPEQYISLMGSSKRSLRRSPVSKPSSSSPAIRASPTKTRLPTRGKSAESWASAMCLKGAYAKPPIAYE
jgi:adenylate cyclase